MSGAGQGNGGTLTGAEASLPAWTSFMKAATASRPELDFQPPSGVVVAKVDPLTGYLAGPNCPAAVSGVFPSAMAPTEVCPFHKAAGAASPVTDQGGAHDGESDTGATLDDSPND